MKYFKLIFFYLLSFFSVSANGNADDRLAQATSLPEHVVAFSSSKETDSLRQRPVAGSLITGDEIENKKVNSLKELSSVVPNFYIPDYGSKITSSIYVRGIGSRIDQPSVGLYIDGVPILNKSLFDFDFYEIQQMEILRGPQSTLYGRNTMGGIINIQTVLPDTTSRYTNLSVSYGNYNDLRIKASHFDHIGRVAFMVGGYGNYNEGFFTNEYNGKKIDEIDNAGGRVIVCWEKSSFSLHYTGGYDYTKQGGYPYAQYDTLTGKTLPVNYNDHSGYRRTMFNNGLVLKWRLPWTEISSATGYQYLNDRMDLDQDFTAQPVFTLIQKQQEHAFTEEILFKSVLSEKNYQWLFGLFGFYKNLHAQAPVTFKEKGISGLIEDNANNVFRTNPIFSTINAGLDILDDSFVVGDDFSYPTYGLAFFHQSTYKNFLIPGLSITAGIRADYEKAKLDYDSRAEINYLFSGMGAPLAGKVPTKLFGSEQNDFFQVLPKIAFKYDLDKDNNVYVSVSKGYKAGGFNTQMFADILEYQMQSDLKADLYRQVPDIKIGNVNLREMLAPILLSENKMNIRNVIRYDPEQSWNYEIGTHLTLLQKKLLIDVAVFYVDCRDQQITVFSPQGMGRMMKNAGQTESYGVESEFKYQPIENLNINLSYGYTHATFKEYEDGTNDYAGNYVPQSPQNTFSAGGDYTWKLKDKFIDRIFVRLQYAGAGKIYWSEKNNICQNFYGLLNGSAGVEKNTIKLEFWAKNILNTSYDTFYFENLGNNFLQKGKPLQIGACVKYVF